MTTLRMEWQRHLAGLYQTSMEGSTVQKVYDHRVVNLKGLSPVVCVSAVGTDYLAGPQVYGAETSQFLYDVITFVLYSDTKNNYTNEDAEEQLANIEQQIREVNEQNGSVSGKWSTMDYVQASRAASVVISGVTYHVETIRLRLGR